MVYKNSLLTNFRRHRNRKLKLYFFSGKPQTNLNLIKRSLYIPSQWYTAIISPKRNANFTILFLYSTTYFFQTPIPTNTFSTLNFCQYSKVLSFFDSATPQTPWPLYINTLRHTLFSFSKPVFLRLKFKGKGYYIFKNKRNTVAPQFGYAHRIYIYTLFLSVKFLRKTSVLVFGLTPKDLSFVGTQIYSKRPVNIFTNRGVRFSRQYIYKKKGKVSTYR